MTYCSYALETKIIFPSYNETIYTQTFTIKGTSKTLGIKLFINNDSPFQLETVDNEFEFDVLLPSGNHTVKIIDDDGTENSISFNVNTELFINIEVPTHNSVIQSSFITIIGNTKPSAIVKINFNDAHIGTTVSDELGNFSYNLPLSLGNHVLEATAYTSETQASTTVAFFVAKEFFITIDEPLTGTLVQNNPLRIQGKAKQGSKVSLFILKNHIASECDFETDPITVIEIGDQEYYSFEVFLTDGFYTIKASAIDAQSNFAEARSTIQVDVNTCNIIIDQEETGNI